ncbi:hypothetical protein CH354_10620 [Leptospira levettii]|uniref:cell surface protein MPL17 n=1 Tax=Leptospira levettii TaxID=2023178 RepID=UPI000C2A1DC3|nr:hypothetical protein [Leptospira levettii]MCW7472760.1 hypothetical protein [Leptospira levettii]PJZ37491.1 hypothetical protein CH354_10620 [Leptospira levettii]PJZ88416.1 hypothetical protein CH368_11915 [Leptospira levettii]PKA00417.1 hypothetical protein CH369_07980 [Leptospira levettii]TGL11312.1 hypothetical protein EHQ39_07025 [Leptospira levettii]
MNWKFVTSLFVSILIFGFVGCNESKEVQVGETMESHPIEVSIKEKSSGKYELELFLPKDFGFQIEAPHRIFLSGSEGLKVTTAELKLTGPTHPKKPEYFEYVKPLTFQVEGKGKLLMEGKLFYCNFLKNICIPAKVTKTFSI